MRLCAIVVNYRTAITTVKSLQNLLADLADFDAFVVIVDNDSQDGSEAVLRNFVEGSGEHNRVQVIQAGRNGGFGYGNNVGIRWALQSGECPDYFLLINPDAYPEPGTCRALVEFMDCNPKAGILGTAIRGIEGTLRRSAFRFPTLSSEFESMIRWSVVTRMLSSRVVAPPIPSCTVKTEWVSGSCMMVRRKLFETVGLFDERFFLYFEEIDLCRRVQQAGWETYWVKDACIVHDAGLATGINDYSRPRPKYWFDSRRYYFSKHYGRAYLWAANVAWLAGWSVWQARRWLQRRPSQNPPRLARDFVKRSF